MLGLKKHIVEYSALIENMLADALHGLLRAEPALLRNVLAAAEPQANRKEVELDAECIDLIACYKPLAKDLRAILMILNMNRDLERIGDHAVNIAQSALAVLGWPLLKDLADLPRMGVLTRNMLAEIVRAFIQEDAALAQRVCARDDEVDELRTRILRELTARMTADTSTIASALPIIRISANLERIADLATNIGEDIAFMVDGRVLKHRAPKEAE